MRTSYTGLVLLTVITLVVSATTSQAQFIPIVGQPVMTSYEDPIASGQEQSLAEAYADLETPTNAELTQQIRDVLEMATQWQGTLQAPEGVEWLEQRDAFVQTCVDYFAAIYPASWARPELESMRRDGAALINAGCNDSIVVMFYGLILDEMGLPGEALPWLRLGYFGASRHYTPTAHLLRAMCAARMRNAYLRLGDTNAAEVCSSYVAYRILSMFANDAFGTEKDQPAIYELLGHYCLPSLSPQYSAYLKDDLRWCEYSSEWICKMVAADYFLAMRGPSRPNAFQALKESPSGSNQYGSNDSYPTQARQYYMASHMLHPEWPQAATGLISVTTMEGYYYDTSPGFSWFVQAASAQVDYLPAYHALLNSQANLPPWQRYNNASAVNRWAKLWLESGREDTIIPAMGIPALLLAAQGTEAYSRNYNQYYDRPRPSSPFKDPLTGSGVSLEALDRYAQEGTPDGLQQWVAPLLTVAEYDRKNWEGVVSRSESIGEHSREMEMLQSLLVCYGTDAKTAVGQAMIESGPRSDALKRARAEYKAKRYDNALNLLSQIGTSTDIPPEERLYLNKSIRLILRTRDLRAGRWVNIMPAPDMASWAPASGDAWIDSTGRLILGGSDYTRGVYYMRPVGATLLLRGVMGTGGSSNVTAGPALNSPEGYYPTGLMMSPRQGVAALMRGNWDRTNEASFTPTSECHFNLSVWKQRVGYGIDGTWLVTDGFAQYLQPTEENTLTLQTINSSGWSSTGDVVYFSDLQVRQLPRAPMGDTPFDDSPAPSAISAVLTGLSSDQSLPSLVEPKSKLVQNRSGHRYVHAAPTARRLARTHLDGVTCEDFYNAPPLAPVLKVPDLPDLPSEHIGGDPVFTDQLGLPGYLTGLRLRFAPYQMAEYTMSQLGLENVYRIQSVQPIYRTAFGDRLGGRNGLGIAPPIDVRAVPGYAVGGIACTDGNEGQPITAIQVIFMRMKPDGTLDPSDSYRSAWYGAHTGSRELRSDGRPVVGIVGNVDSLTHSLGLVFADRADLTDIELPESAVAQPTLPVPDQLHPQIVVVDGNVYLLLVGVTHTEALHIARQFGGELLAPETDTERALVKMWGTRWDRTVRTAPGTDSPPAPPSPATTRVVYSDQLGQYAQIPDAMAAPAIVKLSEDPRPADQQQLVVQIGDTYYALIPYAATFSQAEAICEAIGGQFASIHDAETNAVLSPLASDAAYVGLFYDAAAGPTWVDGTPVDYDALVKHQFGDVTNGSKAIVYSSDLGWRFLEEKGQTLWFYCQWDHEPPADLMQVAWEAYLAELARPQQPTAPTSTDSAGPVKSEPIEFEGHWYQAFYEPKTWTDAQAHCEELGGHLIFINSEEENQFALLFVDASQRIWIGATDEVTEGEWLWADGSEITFSAWASQEPNDWEGQEDHADLHLMPDGSVGWNDWNGDLGARDFTGIIGFAYVCEWDEKPEWIGTDSPEGIPEDETDE